MQDSLKSATSKIPTAIPISIPVFFDSGLIDFLLIGVNVRRRFRDIPMEQAASSIISKGKDRKRSSFYLTLF